MNIALTCTSWPPNPMLGLMCSCIDRAYSQLSGRGPEAVRVLRGSLPETATRG